jgi:hypothetical protein
MTRTCSECGTEIDGEYHVEVYDVENPAETGYVNPAVWWLQDKLGTTSKEMRYPTCPDCSPPRTPPTPNIAKHQNEAVFAALFGVLGAVGAVSPPPEYSGLVYGIVALVAGVIAIGEYVQICRIKAREDDDWERPRGVTPRLAGDKTPRQKYLAGEIDEGELEARLEEEFDDTEEEQRELVMER